MARNKNALYLVENFDLGLCLHGTVGVISPTVNEYRRHDECL